MALKDTNEHHGADESLGRMVKYRIVQCPDVFTPVKRVFGQRLSVVKPGWVNVIVTAANMD